MSTIAKIDPRVRRERADRKELRRGLQRVIAFLKMQVPPPLHRIALATLTADVLDDVTRNPRMTGTRKGEVFTYWSTTNESSTAEPSAG